MDVSLSVNVDRSSPVNEGDDGQCEKLVLADIAPWLPEDEQEWCPGKALTNQKLCCSRQASNSYK